MAKSKRGNSEGSITKRSDGRWMARLTLPSGRRKSMYARTRQEAARKLMLAQKSLADGLPMADERLKTDEFLHWWLKDAASPG